MKTFLLKNILKGKTVKIFGLLILIFSTASIKAQCAAAFTPSGCVNGYVQFWNSSSGTSNNTAYTWTFGDGGQASTQHTSHTYSSNGIYNVCLTIKDSINSCFSTKCMTVNINCVNSSSSTCQAAFTPSGCVNGFVQFWNTSTGTTNNTNYSWTFGDGGVAFTKNTSHTYTANGIYNVCLTLTDSMNNCNSTKCMTVNVNCVNSSSSTCQAAFTPSGCVNGFVQFWNTSTGTTNNTNYSWTFGDGGVAFSKNASHTYTANGIYNVCLTLTDSMNNCNSTKCMTVNVNCVSSACQANFSYSNCVNGTMQFYSTSSGTSNQTIYNWTFGDGGTASIKNPAHTYTANGTYLVCLTINDSLNNCTDSICKSVNINCVNTGSCQANFSYSACVNNGTMQFFNTSTGTSGLTFYSWNFGDGSSGTGQNPAHTYTANGLYYVCLTITDSTSNCSSTKCDSVYIGCVNTSIKKISGNTGLIKVFPNPNNGIFQLEISGADQKQTHIVMYNLLGEEVYSAREELVNGSLSVRINLENIANGAYFIRISSEAGSNTLKVIVNR